MASKPKTTQIEYNLDNKALKMLNKLARTVVKIFMEPKDLLTLNVIIREKRVTEKQLLDELKFDIKLLRTTLDTLKDEKIIGVKTEGDKNSEGKRVFNYVYSIKYENLVNMVKYKLEKVRNELESLGKYWSNKPSFVCTTCNRTWSDMEAGELFDSEFMEFMCWICKKPVKEDVSQIPADRLTQIAKFNEQMGCLYDLVREIEIHFEK